MFQAWNYLYPLCTVVVLYLLIHEVEWWRFNTNEYGLDWATVREGIELRGYASAVMPNMKKLGVSNDVGQFQFFFDDKSDFRDFRRQHQTNNPRKLDLSPDYPSFMHADRVEPDTCSDAETYMENLKHFKMLDVASLEEALSESSNQALVREVKAACITWLKQARLTLILNRFAKTCCPTPDYNAVPSAIMVDACLEFDGKLYDETQTETLRAFVNMIKFRRI